MFELQSGASDSAIMRLGRKLGIEIPAPLRDLLLVCDGDQSEPPMLSMLGVDSRLLSCAGIDSAVQSIKNAEADFGSVEVEAIGNVRAVSWDSGWIPFISSPYTSYVVDLNPPVGGINGQIVLVDVENYRVEVVSSGLDAFFDEISARIRNGFYILGPDGFWVSADDLDVQEFG